MTFWAWIRKYGAWIGGGLLLAAGFLLGIGIRKRPVTAAPDPERKRIEEQTARQEQDAVRKREKEKEEASHDCAQYDVVTRDLQKKLDKATEEAADPPFWRTAWFGVVLGVAATSLAVLGGAYAAHALR